MQDDLQQVRLHLLKTTYQLSAEAHPDLHAAAARVAQALGISPAISLYQSNDAGGANVAIYTAASEAHIIFQGPVLGMLGGAEIGTDTLLRWYVLHVLMLPFVIVIFMAIHFWRVRKDGGISGPL